MGTAVPVALQWGSPERTWEPGRPCWAFLFPISQFCRGQEILELCCGWKRSARKWLEPTRTQTQLREVNGLGRGTRAAGVGGWGGGTVGSARAQMIRWTPFPFNPCGEVGWYQKGGSAAQTTGWISQQSLGRATSGVERALSTYCLLLCGHFPPQSEHVESGGGQTFITFAIGSLFGFQQSALARERMSSLECREEGLVLRNSRQDENKQTEMC